MCAFVHHPKQLQEKRSANSSTYGRAFSKQNHDAHSFLRLQRMVGNQTVMRLLQTKSVSSKNGLRSSAQTELRHNYSHIPVHMSSHGNMRPKLKPGGGGNVSDHEADMSADQESKQDASEEEVANEAIQMNRDLGGRTLPAGKNIYFPTVRHYPQSTEGTKLPAYERPPIVRQNQHINHVNQPLLQRTIPESAGRSGVSQTRLAEVHRLIQEYRELRRLGSLSEEEIREVSSAISIAESAIRRAEQVAGAGSTMRTGARYALGGVVFLVANDVTKIGVADNIAIPFVLIAAGALSLGAAIASNSTQEIQRSQQNARNAVTGVIRAIGQILLAQQVGNRVRGNTNQIIIHLARFLGTAVAGRPPDHQGDPERDRPHWWREIKNFIQQIQRTGLSRRQLLRELRRRFSEEELRQIGEALREVARRMGENPPNFPPALP